MGKIPPQCPKCGRKKEWKEVPNPWRGSVVKGLLAKPIKRAMGLDKLVYQCHRCGFREEYDLSHQLW